MSGDPQACWFGPYPFPTHPWPGQPLSPFWIAPVAPTYQPTIAPTSVDLPAFPPVALQPPALSDADVDRIARRVVELLQSKNGGGA